MNSSPHSSWFYAENGDRKGPVPLSELQELIKQGLPKDSLVWSEGMAEWAPASTVPALQVESPGSSGNPASTNPYSPPSSSASAEAAPMNLDYQLPDKPIPLDIGFCIGQGWKHTLGNFGSVFLFGLCYFLVSFGASFVLASLAVMVDGQPTVAPVFEGGTVVVENQKGPFSYLMDLVDTIFSVFLGLGAVRWGHRFLNGENPPIGELFSQGSKLITAVLAGILFGLAVVVGLILLIIPGIIIALRLQFYQQAIVEKNLGIIDSLKYSWDLTRENTLTLLGFAILCFLVALAGLLALIIGLIWAIPTVWLAYLIAFRFLHNGANGVRVLP